MPTPEPYHIVHTVNIEKQTRGDVINAHTGGNGNLAKQYQLQVPCLCVKKGDSACPMVVTCTEIHSLPDP